MELTLILTIVSVIISAVSLGVAALVLKSVKGGKNDGAVAGMEQKLDYISRNIGDEFQRSRTDSREGNREIREEMKKSLDDMSQRIDNMNKGNFEHREKVSEMLINMRDKNAEQSERQNKVLESSISKMQESNEKKLEQMRMTVDEKLNETLTKRLDGSFKTVADQLENLNKSLGEMQTLSTGVTENVTALNRVLTNVKARGTWAEVQLEGILDRLFPICMKRMLQPCPAQ